MSPHTAHSCDGLCGCVKPAPVRETNVGSLLFAVFGLLLFMQLGELEAELDALGTDFNIPMRAVFELSLLDVDSDRCNGNEALR